jgi:serine/threonine protein kinase
LFGRYYLIDQISKGGMSNIYLAKTVSVGGFQKPLVIKKLLPQYATKSSYVKRFVNEANILTRLSHANIVQILDMGIIDGEYYIATEYIEGRNVAHIMSKASRNGKMPSLEFIVYLMTELGRGLAYAHDKKTASGEDLMLVHRDVNSFNVMVSYEAEVKLIDFGIVRASLEKEIDDGLPVAGKLLYFSPEQLLKKPVDRRCDIYGMGVLLYEVLTGTRLVDHQETISDTVKSILELNIKEKVEGNDKIDEDLAAILVKAMAMEPDQRYPHMGDMIEDLRTVIRKRGLEHRVEKSAEYMKELFHSEILLDRRRMRRLRSEEVPRRAASLEDVSTGASRVELQSDDTDPRAWLLSASSWPFSENADVLDDQAQISPLAKCFAAGKKIFRQGEPGSEIYVILKGKVRLYLKTDHGHQTLQVLKEGDFFGEYAIIDENCRPMSAVAEEECVLVGLDKTDFPKLMPHDLGRRIIYSLISRLADTLSLFESALLEDSLSRLVYALMYYMRSGRRMNGADIDMTEMLDTFRLSNDDQLQKYLNKLKALDILDADEKNIHIKSAETLENILNVLVGRGKFMLKL